MTPADIRVEILDNLEDISPDEASHLPVMEYEP